ncbi:hypothetical protein L3Q82_017820 [Scortum barcoo]|uniref:Uncharacterized protein n=1 Tax=Scortum barcoo TaxID=214431 RepID=A0ACB8VLZ5_9TELE|nr:hypothetical protein L3Q82_017820 [Scortum barcoo]
MEFPVSRSTRHYQVPPLRDSKKAWYSTLYCCSARVGTNNSKRLIPNPKARREVTLFTLRGELQHMAAELGTSPHQLATPLTLGNSRVVEGPAPLKELGSRAQAMLCMEYKRHLSTTSNSQTPNSTMAKTKELSKDTRNKIVDLHQSRED